MADKQTVSTLLADNVIHLMGLSFILGSLFTILMLVVLDFMRRNTLKRASDRRAD